MLRARPLRPQKNGGGLANNIANVRLLSAVPTANDRAITSNGPEVKTAAFAGSHVLMLNFHQFPCKLHASAACDIGINVMQGKSHDYPTKRGGSYICLD